MKLTGLESLVENDSALLQFKDYLLAIAKQNVAIRISEDVPTGCQSRFGGDPLVPHGFSWPTHEVGEYRFLGHINFAEITDRPTCLPAFGVLALFYAHDENGEVFWGDDGYVIGYYWSDASNLTRTEAPYNDRPVAKQIELSGGIDLPRHEELRNDWPFEIEVLDGVKKVLPVDYMLGYPSHHSLGYDPTPGDDWCALLTLNSHDQFGWCWHDGSKLMVFIERSKLATADFSRLKSDAG